MHMKGLARILAIAALLAAGNAVAASLFVRPTTVVFAPGSSAATVTVTNSGDAPVTAQLRMFSWTQSDNEDKLDPTQAIAASPPMSSIPPGQSQTIRLVRTVKGPVLKEESYRLYVDEILDRKATESASAIQIQLRYSVPVFLLLNAKDMATLAATARFTNGSVTFEATNTGKAHAQLSKVEAVFADGSSRSLVAGLLGYVLPEKSRHWAWVLPAGTPGPPKKLRVLVNGQELLLDL
jgi:fimbrial chaperone protein